MTIVGRETVTLLSKVWGPEDKYGNPTETTTERVINNVLVAQSGSTINYGLQDTSTEIDIELRMNAREAVRSTDEFIYEGRNYLQVGVPTLWKTARGSLNKPKLIVRLKKKD